eukprot:17903-Heterococcus_DN1.PRE.1
MYTHPHTFTGYIDAIDYATGTLSIEQDGGPGAKVRINDPTGRYGRATITDPAFDARFCVDPDNPTIRSATGFPMCIPRSAAEDPECPSTNRPKLADGTFNPAFTMVRATGDTPHYHHVHSMLQCQCSTDATMAMCMYATGTISLDGSFIAAYEIINNVAVYTAPGVDPAYTVFEVAIIGTGGLNVLGAACVHVLITLPPSIYRSHAVIVVLAEDTQLPHTLKAHAALQEVLYLHCCCYCRHCHLLLIIGEAAIRSVYEGFTTDASRPVEIFGLDFNPTDGSFTKREFGQVMPDPGPAGAVGSVQGRWRFRPQCTVQGPLTPASPYLGNKGCTPPAGGVYTPPPREVMSNIVGCTQSSTGTLPGCSYRNPAIEYIWGENVPGAPIVENNFNSVPFLTRGGYTSSLGTIVSTLDPWPSNILPADSCLAPTITIGGPYTVSAGGAVTVSADVSGPGAPFTYTWTADAAAGGNSGATNQLTASFSPVTASTTYTLTVTNSCGNPFSSKATVNVVTSPRQAIQAIASQTVGSGESLAVCIRALRTPLHCTGSCALYTAQRAARLRRAWLSKTNVSITAKLSASTTDVFTWTAPAGIAITQQPAANVATATSTITFNAPVIPANTVDVLSLAFTVTAGAAGTLSDEVTALVTVQPPTDIVSLTAVLFRCDKHRMVLTATSNVINQNVQLTLLPYTDNKGQPFNPASLGTSFTNTGGGIHTITIEPVPLPSTTLASLSVKSSLGGTDAHRIVTADIKGTCAI